MTAFSELLIYVSRSVNDTMGVRRSVKEELQVLRALYEADELGQPRVPVEVLSTGTLLDVPRCARVLERLRDRAEVKLGRSSGKVRDARITARGRERVRECDLVELLARAGRRTCVAACSAAGGAVATAMIGYVLAPGSLAWLIAAGAIVGGWVGRHAAAT